MCWLAACAGNLLVHDLSPGAEPQTILRRDGERIKTSYRASRSNAARPDARQSERSCTSPTGAEASCVDRLACLFHATPFWSRVNLSEVELRKRICEHDCRSYANDIKGSLVAYGVAGPLGLVVCAAFCSGGSTGSPLILQLE
jgi:hypothetical protein